MVNRPIDAMAELQNAFNVLFKNLVLAVPTALVSAIAAIFFVFVVAATATAILGAGAIGGYHPGFGAFLGGAGLTMILGCVVIVLLALLAQAVVMAGAERVWQGQPADLGHGVSQAMAKLPPLFGLFILAIIVFGICGILIVIGWILAVVLAFFFMFTVPAIVVGNQGIGDALRSSYAIVRANVGPSLTAFLGIIVVSVVGGIINQIVVHIPVLGIIVALIVGGLTSAYAALVAVRFYDLLRVSAPAAARVPGTTT